MCKRSNFQSWGPDFKAFLGRQMTLRKSDPQLADKSPARHKYRDNLMKKGARETRMTLVSSRPYVDETKSGMHGGTVLGKVRRSPAYQICLCIAELREDLHVLVVVARRGELARPCPSLVRLPPAASSAALCDWACTSRRDYQTESGGSQISIQDAGNVQ